MLGVGKSLLQLTVERFSGVIPADHVWVVTSKDYKELVKAQVPGIRDEQVLLEPCRRNTAPCIAYVTCKIKKEIPGSEFGILPGGSPRAGYREISRGNHERVGIHGLVECDRDTGHGA